MKFTLICTVLLLAGCVGTESPGTFHGYPCTEECSGHIAGYEWAENNDIDSIYDCDSNSNSFTEGCEIYVGENY